MAQIIPIAMQAENLYKPLCSEQISALSGVIISNKVKL
jgi:hypothetical protein